MFVNQMDSATRWEEQKATLRRRNDGDRCCHFPWFCPRRIRSGVEEEEGLTLYDRVPMLITSPISNRYARAKHRDRSRGSDGCAGERRWEARRITRGDVEGVEDLSWLGRAVRSSSDNRLG